MAITVASQVRFCQMKKKLMIHKANVDNILGEAKAIEASQAE